MPPAGCCAGISQVGGGVKGGLNPGPHPPRLVLFPAAGPAATATWRWRLRGNVTPSTDAFTPQLCVFSDAGPSEKVSLPAHHIGPKKGPTDGKELETGSRRDVRIGFGLVFQRAHVDTYVLGCRFSSMVGLMRSHSTRIPQNLVIRSRLSSPDARFLFGRRGGPCEIGRGAWGKEDPEWVSYCAGY